MKVAYIGLGSMGGDQVKQIAKSDLDLCVYDVSEKARAIFAEITQVADSAADAVANADAIHICVRDSDQVNDVLFGSGKVVEFAKRGAVVAIHSTIAAKDVELLSARLADSGLTVCDSPVTRTTMDASGRFVMTMVGGTSDSVERIKPVLNTYSTDIIHVGQPGAAAALKMANNMMTWTQIVVGYLTWQLSEAYGVSFEHLKKVTKANGNLTMVTEAFLSGAADESTLKNPDHFAFLESQAGIGNKDLQLAIAAGSSAELDMRMIEIAQQLLPEAMLGKKG